MGTWGYRRWVVMGEGVMGVREGMDIGVYGHEGWGYGMGPRVWAQWYRHQEGMGSGGI